MIERLTDLVRDETGRIGLAAGRVKISHATLADDIAPAPRGCAALRVATGK